MSPNFFFNRTGIPGDPNCFVVLPSGFHPDVNCLPPLQSHEDTLIERATDEVKVCDLCHQLIYVIQSKVIVLMKEKHIKKFLKLAKM